MSTIIRAKVTTNSSDDSQARVKIMCEELLNETPLLESVGGMSLKKGDIVFVDVSNGYDAPLIIGRSFDKATSYSKQVNGSVLFESSNGSSWTIAFVKNNDLEIYNSDKSSIVVKGSKIIINSETVVVSGGKFKVSGSAVPNGNGAFCGIPVCPFTGATHVGDTVSNT